MHASPDCTGGSTANRDSRNLKLCIKNTRWILLLFRRMKPKFWTLEQIMLVAQYILRLLPAMVNLYMLDYNTMPSNRRRVIGSSAPLELERLNSAEYNELYKSPLQVAREHCAESEQTDFTQVDNLMMMNAFNHIKKGRRAHVYYYFHSAARRR